MEEERYSPGCCGQHTRRYSVLAVFLLTGVYVALLCLILMAKPGCAASGTCRVVSVRAECCEQDGSGCITSNEYKLAWCRSTTGDTAASAAASCEPTAGSGSGNSSSGQLCYAQAEDRDATTFGRCGDGFGLSNAQEVQCCSAGVACDSSPASAASVELPQAKIAYLRVSRSVIWVVAIVGGLAVLVSAFVLVRFLSKDSEHRKKIRDMAMRRAVNKNNNRSRRV